MTPPQRQKTPLLDGRTLAYPSQERECVASCRDSCCAGAEDGGAEDGGVDGDGTGDTEQAGV